MWRHMKIEGNLDIHTLLQKLREGTKFLPFAKYGLQLSVAASILGAAGFVLAVRDGKVGNFMSIGQPWYSDGLSSPEKLWLVPGLRNLGNNCFLNVILQALASCSSFRRYLQMIIEEYGFSSLEESAETLPLTYTLVLVLEKLCMVQHRRSVVSPRQVMVAMEHYMPTFRLTCQQDAEEALFHLLSSLREELWGCYIPNHCSLGDVTAEFNLRMLTPRGGAKESEQQRWRRSFLGPFDGILGSSLSCQSCSLQISLEFQLFHSLHLAPPVPSGGRIMPGCSVEDCLKHFFISERLENYFCNHCWHVGAIKYLSLIGENEADVQILQQCNKDDSCHCKNLSSLKALPWSNTFSRSFKQLSLTRSPQILCIHLQRASVNIFGELVKLQGHISFPLILDLSPFVNTGVGGKNMEGSSQNGQQRMYHHQTTFAFPNNAHETDLRANFPQNGNCADESMKSIMPVNPGSKEGGSFPSSSPHRDNLYRLVSVVEHFGKVGSGHYTVYRRVRLETSDDDPVLLLQPNDAQWFSISDSEVYNVSEKDVLNAEASLVFYEKMF